MFRNAPTSPHSHAGFLLPLALILLVGISFMAIAVSRLSGQTGTHATVEGLSVQAFYAAESAAQVGMSRLLYNVTTRAQADVNCANMSGVTVNYSVTGLSLCSATLSCLRTIDAGDTTSYYRINSVGRCGVAQLLGEREIEIAASMQ